MKIPLLVKSIPEKRDPDKLSEYHMLEDAAAKLGHTLDAFTPSMCKLVFDGQPKLLVNGVHRRFKAVLVRPRFSGAKIEMLGSIIKQLELCGARTVNTFSATMKTKNKISQLQKLTQQRIPMPRTYVVDCSAFTEDIASKMRFPFIVKTPYGAQGVGVAIAESKRSLGSFLDLVTRFQDEDHHGESTPIIVQEYIRESKGKDIRIFVVGKKIVAAMDRIAQKRDEFRSNFSLGGRVKIAELTEKEKQLALRTAAAMGLEIAGVDVIRSSNGPKVLEVNSYPGIKGITQATGVDVAGAMIKYMATILQRMR